MGHSRRGRLANWKQEEPGGRGGRRQPSVSGTSRVTGDCHARICESLGVRFPGATRQPAIKNKMLKMITDPKVLPFLDGLAEIIVEEILTSENVQEKKD